MPALAQAFKGAPLQALNGDQAPQSSAADRPKSLGRGLQTDHAAVQLQALQILLLFLPLPLPQVLQSLVHWLIYMPHAVAHQTLSVSNLICFLLRLVLAMLAKLLFTNHDNLALSGHHMT